MGTYRSVTVEENTYVLSSCDPDGSDEGAGKMRAECWSGCMKMPPCLSGRQEVLVLVPFFPSVVVDRFMNGIPLVSVISEYCFFLPGFSLLSFRRMAEPKRPPARALAAGGNACTDGKDSKKHLLFHGALRVVIFPRGMVEGVERTIP